MDVHSQADDDLGRAGGLPRDLGQYPGELASSPEQVVRPFEREARAAAERRAHAANTEKDDTEIQLVSSAIESVMRDTEILKSNYQIAMQGQDFAKAAEIQQLMGEKSAQNLLAAIEAAAKVDAVAEAFAARGELVRELGVFALLRQPLLYMEPNMLFAVHENFLWMMDLSQPDKWILPILAGIVAMAAGAYRRYLDRAAGISGQATSRRSTRLPNSIPSMTTPLCP